MMIKTHDDQDGGDMKYKMMYFYLRLALRKILVGGLHLRLVNDI